VIPIAITGTGDALPKHGVVLRQRMRATVRVLAPIPSAHVSADALREAARDAIVAALPEENRPAIR
jgi:1-acyl-sn-glycerol-3-phosphate acyltransferase